MYCSLRRQTFEIHLDMIIHPEITALSHCFTRDVLLDLGHILPNDLHLLNVRIFLFVCPFLLQPARVKLWIDC